MSIKFYSFKNWPRIDAEEKAQLLKALAVLIKDTSWDMDPVMAISCSQAGFPVED